MKNLAKSLIVLFVLSFLYACSDSSPTEDTPKDPVCEAGETLIDGVCNIVPPDCGESEELIEGKCLTKCNEGERRENGECISEFWLPKEVYEKYGNGDYQFKANFDPEDRTLTIDTITSLRKLIYDANGNILTVEYHRNGDRQSQPRTWSEEYTYDTNGNRLTYEYHDFGNLNTPVTYSKKYTYDANGNLFIVESHWNDGLNSPVTYSEEHIYDASDNLLFILRYEYFDGAEDGVDFEKYTYDSNNNLLTYEYHSYDEESWGAKYTYDNMGNILSGEREENGTTLSSIKFEYDTSGNRSSLLFSTYYNGVVKSKLEEYTYDEDGKLLDLKRHWGETDTPISDLAQYEYDNLGNLTGYKIKHSLFPPELQGHCSSPNTKGCGDIVVSGTLQNYVPVQKSLYFSVWNEIYENNYDSVLKYPCVVNVLFSYSGINYEFSLKNGHKIKVLDPRSSRG